MIQRVVELTFAGEDIRIVAVGNGQQAIDRLADDPPDIVLADVGMPLLDGYAVASFVRNHDALRDVPVLLLVGAFDPVDEERVQASGAAGVLVKPFEPTLVISRVKELLGLNARSRSAVTTAPLETAAISPNPPVAPKSSAVADFEPEWIKSPSGDASLTVAATFGGAPAEAIEDHRQFPVDALWTEADAALASPLHAAHAPSRSGSNVADAFAALLAAEQGELTSPAEPLWLEPEQMDALVGEVAIRVADRLGTAAVCERIDRIVSDVAERLVREEIARIRGAVSARQG